MSGFDANPFADPFASSPFSVSVFVYFSVTYEWQAWHKFNLM